MSKPKVFKSIAEFRQHFFPDKFRKEQELERISTILDESKYDKPIHRRQLTDDQIVDLDGKTE